ncbi:hypothetical protein EDB85DRAFT_2274996, partial [Lactarius pseudohatsudake]
MSSHIGKEARPRLSSKERYHSSLRIVNGTTGQDRRAACGVGLVRSSIIWNRPQGCRWRYQAHCPREVFHAYMVMRGDERVSSGVLVQLDRILVEDIRAQYTRLIAKIGNGLTIFTSVLVPLYKALKIQLIVAFLVAFTKSQRIVDTGSNPVRVSLVHSAETDDIVKLKLKPITNSEELSPSPFLRLFHLRDTRFVYSTLLFIAFRNPYRTTVSKTRQGLAVAAQNLHSDCKTRP